MSSLDRAVWQNIIQSVVAEGGNIIRPWFTDLQPLGLEHGLLEILAPGGTESDYCQKYAMDLFTQAAQKATGRLVSVCFLASPQETDELPEDLSRAFDIDSQPQSTPSFNREYTFDSFVTGPCNRLASAACLAVSDSPGMAYNPLFLHGASGLGKTHLLQGTCRQILQSDPDTKIQILSCEEFVNHFIDAVERGKLHDFRNRYRHVDVLAIDDIQFLAGHEQSQEEFFHTFNTLYQARKQIILSSDRGPKETLLEERLISRFHWGLVSHIDRPCYETRVAILHKKARQRGVELPEEVVCFIAGSIDQNTRELEGAIAKVAMLAQVADRPVDLAMAGDALGHSVDPAGREVTIDDILKVVTEQFSVRLIDLQSKKRSRSIAFPRQICMYMARNLTRHSLEEIGGYFGGRDHTTVLHANRSIESKRKEDPQFQVRLERLMEEVQSIV